MTDKTKIINSEKQKGFTLVETLVAVFVLVVAVVAPMTIASKALSAARHAKEQITAFYLAQEGAELVRNIVGNNVLSQPPAVWNEGGNLGDPISETNCYSNQGCKIESTDLVVSACDAGNGCDPLYINNAGLYTYTGGSLTPFVRTIKLLRINDTEIKILSTVSWYSAGLGTRETGIMENLFNWY